MRVTIIPVDGFVSVDGFGLSGIDTSSIPDNVHAVQWYGSSGEIELKNTNGKIISNEEIDSLEQFASVIAVYNEAAAAYAAEQLAIAEAQTVIEV